MNNNLNKFHSNTLTEDITIDIFCESMTEYLQKLNAASVGRYELDDYDLKVLSIAMEQFATCMR
jgi:hypothetical protein